MKGTAIFTVAVFFLLLAYSGSAESWGTRGNRDDGRFQLPVERENPRFRTERRERMTLQSGTVLQVPGDAALYYMINGYAAHIPSPRVLQCMGLSRQRRATVSNQQLAEMPKTAFLIRARDGRVYRIDGEYRRHVPNMQVFRRLGFNDAEVIPVSDGVIQCIPEGPPLR